jgi:pimeloyl-ACP methyl ester carboxylesterase
MLDRQGMGVSRRRAVLAVRSGWIVFLLVLSPLVSADEPAAKAADYGAYYGNYQIAPDHLIGIDRFIMDSGEAALLFSDYKTGVVRRVKPMSEGEFVMGPGFDVQAPEELKLRFTRDGNGAVTRVSLQPAHGSASVAERVALKEEEVAIYSGDAKLAGTLLLPRTKGPHPAIILLHGSGPLTRYSFGPYPHFFTSLGFAVLIYDKRGTGASTGTRLDASTGASAPVPNAFYPDSLVSDALAVVHYLRRRPEINPDEIGVWGSSEGGMLTTQLAARSKDVAFAINSSGFVGPLWETLEYQAGTNVIRKGLTSAQAKEATEFAQLWMNVARTGEGYDAFAKKREQAIRENKQWMLSYFSDEYTSAAQMHWDWEHILAFDSRIALKSVTCPVLGVFGEEDPLTNAAEAAKSLREGLLGAGNMDVTVKVFPKAGHSLSETPSGSRMATGVFDTLRSWLLARVHR